MPHKDSGWEPKGRALQYDGDPVDDHAVGVAEINDAEREPEDDEE